MPIEIDEVLRRSEQGATEPYICRGSDGKLYFVKGKGAGYDSLIKEWVAGQIALHLGLPVPRFCIVTVPRELYEAGRDGPLRDLGYGLLFGSENVENANEMSFVNILQAPAELKHDIAAFDWWIQNGDRTLTDAGGNPNLLWSETEHRLVVIDHNLAFDEEVTLHSQLQSHIFRSSLSEICDQTDLQDRYNSRFEQALMELPQILGDIPERWHYVDDACTVEINLSLGRVEDTLKRHRVPAFWERT
ncbi:HipA family kinase [Rhizobium sp. FKY42]|uniref:HipA family kinase n=1 Tax=Rhizobium sp. FKY42 TaxID=2562310 RepID=UPI0010BFAB20|nr:HipA family kinase [Rhizobium sp. FKY42]